MLTKGYSFSGWNEDSTMGFTYAGTPTPAPAAPPPPPPPPPPTRQYYDVEEDAAIAQNKAAIGGRGNRGGAGSYGNKWWDEDRTANADFAEGGLVDLIRRHMQKYQ
jgi:hypothetical protein